MTTVEEPPAVDLASLIEFMRAKAMEQGDSPQPLMQGTFALYPTPDGGIMMVASVPDGPIEGIHHYRMTPALMRGMSMLFGGNKMSAVKGMFRRGRKEIGDGR